MADKKISCDKQVTFFIYGLSSLDQAWTSPSEKVTTVFCCYSILKALSILYIQVSYVTSLLWLHRRLVANKVSFNLWTTLALALAIWTKPRPSAARARIAALALSPDIRALYFWFCYCPILYYPSLHPAPDQDIYVYITG